MLDKKNREIGDGEWETYQSLTGQILKSPGSELEEMNQEKQTEKTRLFYLAGALLLLLIFIYMPVSRKLESLLFDGKIFLYRIFNSKIDNDENKVALIQINDESLEKYSKPLSTVNFITFIKKIRKYNARAVVLLTSVDSMKFSKAQRKVLKKLSGSVPIITSYTFTKDMDGSGKLDIKPSQNNQAEFIRNSGFIMPTPDSDGIYRKSRLGIHISGKNLVSVETAVFGFLRRVSTQNAILGDGSIYLDELRIPTDREYNSIFIPGNEHSYDSYSYHEIMNSSNLKGLEGKILLVGETHGENRNLFTVPFPGKPEKSLLYTTASTLNSLLKNQFISNIPPIMNMALLLLMGAFVGIILPLTDQKRLYLVSFITLLGFLVMSVILFNLGINLEIAPLILMMPFFIVIVISYRYYINHTLVCKFVPDPLIKVLQNGNPDSEFQTVVRTCSVLFSDIKGYTTLSERYNPADVMYMLEEYINVMNKVVEKNGGYIINYQGDGLLAVFGLEDDSDQEKNAKNAVKAALLMQDAIKDLRRKWHVEYRELFVIGIGIATGDIAIGTLGTDTYRQYTVIGNTVNLAARLMGIGKAKRIPVVVNEDTCRLVKNRFRIKSIAPTRIKGKFENCKIFEVEDYRTGKIEISPGVNTGDSPGRCIEKEDGILPENSCNDGDLVVFRLSYSRTFTILSTGFPRILEIPALAKAFNTCSFSILLPTFTCSR